MLCAALHVAETALNVPFAVLFRSTQEQNLIESFLDKDDVMLEWGSGYSTL
jgi:hypothetical protein